MTTRFWEELSHSIHDQGVIWSERVISKYLGHISISSQSKLIFKWKVAVFLFYQPLLLANLWHKHTNKEKSIASPRRQYGWKPRGYNTTGSLVSIVELVLDHVISLLGTPPKIVNSISIKMSKNAETGLCSRQHSVQELSPNQRQWWADSDRHRKWVKHHQTDLSRIIEPKFRSTCLLPKNSPITNYSQKWLLKNRQRLHNLGTQLCINYNSHSTNHVEKPPWNHGASYCKQTSSIRSEKNGSKSHETVRHHPHLQLAPSLCSDKTQSLAN